MFDASCANGTQSLANITNAAYNSWNASTWSNNTDSQNGVLIPVPWSWSSQNTSSSNVTVYGTFNSTQQNGVLVPVWNLTYGQPSTSGPTVITVTVVVITGEGVSSAPSSNGVDWVQYKTSGASGWPTTMYSVDTVGGKPPTTVSSSLSLLVPVLFS